MQTERVGDGGEVRKETSLGLDSHQLFLPPPTPVLRGPFPSFWTRNKGRMRYKLLARGHSNFQATHGSHFHDNPFPWAQSISFHLCHTLILPKHPTPSTHPQEKQIPPLPSLHLLLPSIPCTCWVNEFLSCFFGVLWTLHCS